jgi:hypothetical protein
MTKKNEKTLLRAAVVHKKSEADIIYSDITDMGFFYSSLRKGVGTYQELIPRAKKISTICQRIDQAMERTRSNKFKSKSPISGLLIIVDFENKIFAIQKNTSANTKHTIISVSCLFDLINENKQKHNNSNGGSE